MSDSMECYASRIALLSAKGSTDFDRTVQKAKDDFRRSSIRNPGYRKTATRNGVLQELLIVRTEVPYKYTILAFPGDDLFPGDILNFDDENWIVCRTRVSGTIQTVGVAWLCNQKFRFQNFTNEIYERWGVLDNGVYSTTRTSDATIMTLDTQYKIYLPSDEQTDKIYEDKRIATDQWNDKFGNPILTTYTITGRDRTSKSYGIGAHLLILNARSTSYNPNADNYEEMICDYIPEEKVPSLGSLKCEIVGRTSIRVGSSRTYSPKFFTSDGSTIATGIVPKWDMVDVPGVSHSASGENLIVLCDNNPKLNGATFEIWLSDSGSTYDRVSLPVEVIA